MKKKRMKPKKIKAAKKKIKAKPKALPAHAYRQAGGRQGKKRIPLRAKNKKVTAKKVKVKKPRSKKITKNAVKKLMKAHKKAKAAEKIHEKAGKKGHVVYLGIGSNVGDREEYIEQTVFLLSKTPGIKVTKRSTNYETEAEGVSNQPAFLNAVVEVKTKLNPYQLIEILQETENALGREREVEWGPRTIDIDILFFDDEIMSDDKLSIPHPLIHERIFALMPLAEIAPRKVHPVLEKTVEELLNERKAEAGKKYDDELPGFKEIKKGVADDYERW